MNDAAAQATVTQTVAFADGPGGGNPCPIVCGADAWTREQMQAAAAAFGQETGFVLAAEEEGAAVRLRYFVPNHEMEMCVHATVAAATVLGLEDGAVVQTPLGNRRIARERGEAVTVEQFPAVFGAEISKVDSVHDALGSHRSGSGPVRAVSTSRPKLLVPLAGEAALDALAPDFPRLWTLCDDLDVTGVYAFSEQAAGADVAARQFPLRAGYDEDPATGVAACALGAHLAALRGADGLQRFTIAQGRKLGRPSLMQAQAVLRDGAIVATAVGGRAEILGEPVALEPR